MTFPQRSVDRCPFCKIELGDSERAWVTRGRRVSAFINPRQYERGAMLVITHAHRESVLDLTDDELLEAHTLARELARAAATALDAGGALIYQRNGMVSGQNVPHYHVHVIPRYADSGPNVDVFRRRDIDTKADFATRAELAKRIGGALVLK